LCLELLAINEETGVLTVRGVIDREVVGSQLDFHVLSVLRTSSSDFINDVASCALVRLTIIDIDDNAPYFVRSHYLFSVGENATIGSYVGQVQSVDLDASSSFSQFYYKMNSSLFSVNEATGVIVTAKILDRELAARHNVTVYVQSFNSNKFDNSCVVTIDVTDVNDNPPIFQFPTTTNNTVRVRHDMSLGSVVTRLVAVDADSDENANLTYYMADDHQHVASDSMFRVLPSSGLVLVAGNLSMLRHQIPSRVYVLRATVTDGGSPQLTATASVFLNIIEPLEAGDYLRANYEVTTAVDNAAGHLHMIGIVAFTGCIIIVVMCSLIATLVNRCAGMRMRTSMASKVHGNRNVMWRKVASSEAVESPLYVTSRRQQNADISESTDIILTLDSEPVNYAVSTPHNIVKF
jgi:hypothetical protein